MPAKTLAEKLLIKADTTVWSSDPVRAHLVEPLPTGVQYVDGPAKATTALVFAESADAVRDILTAYRADLAAPTTFWVAYPKGGKANINRDTLWPIVAEYGLRPNGQVAMDDTWSALRFRPLKDGEAPFTSGR
jgi:hypothetical protein